VPTTAYEIHGVSVRVAAPDEVAAAIFQRLRRFASASASDPELDFNFVRCAQLPCATGLITHELNGCEYGPGRAIYELEGGEVLYHPDTDTLTARYRESVRMTCSPVSGRTLYLLTQDEAAGRTASHILFTLPLIELLRRRGLYNIHAAGLCRGEHAVLLPGPSGTGKSTLTLALVRAGWDYMGDDMLFLKTGSDVVLGFPEGIDHFPELGGGSRKTHVRPESDFGSAEILKASPRALIFPSVAHTAESTSMPISDTAAFLKLAPDVLMTERVACKRHLERLSGLTREIPAFRLLTGTNLNGAERMISGLFDRLSISVA
jgi:hypothetical protein